MNAIYQKWRDILIEGLNKLRWGLPKTKATFYVWAPVPPGYTSKDFASKLLRDAGVIVAPGNCYGTFGEGFFRMALTVEKERISEAIRRMKEKNIRFQ